MIQRLTPLSGEWVRDLTNKIKPVIRRLIQRRPHLLNFEEDLENEVIIAVLEEGYSAPYLPDNSHLKRIIDRVCQYWNRKLKAQRSSEIELTEELAQHLSHKEWRDLVLDSEEEYTCPLDKLNHLPISL